MERIPRAVSSRATWADLDVHVHTAEAAHFAAVQEIAKGDQGGGLAGLPRRVQHEVVFRLNQGQELVDVHAVQGWIA